MTRRSAAMYIDADEAPRRRWRLRPFASSPIPGARFRATALAARMLPRPLVRSVIQRLDKDTGT